MERPEDGHPYYRQLIVDLFEGCLYSTFLELGVSTGYLTKKILPLVEKRRGRLNWVDISDPGPIGGDGFVMTTNEFFQSNPGYRYDMIFIDAEHSYGQVLLDFENSLPLMEPGGMILLHDTDPYDQKFARKGHCWDCYKILEVIEDREDLTSITIPIDEAGLTIVRQKGDYRHRRFTA